MKHKPITLWKQAACAAITLTAAGCSHSTHPAASAPTAPVAAPVAAAPGAAFQPYTLVSQPPPVPKIVTPRNRVLRLTKYQGQFMLADSAHRLYHVGRDSEGHLCPIYSDPATHANYPLYYDRERDDYYRLAQYDRRYYRCYVGDSENTFYAVGPEYAQRHFRPQPPVIVNTYNSVTINNWSQPWPRHREHAHPAESAWLVAIPLVAAAYFVLEPSHPRHADWPARQPITVVARPVAPVFVHQNIVRNINNVNIVNNQRTTTVVNNGVRYGSIATHGAALQTPPHAPGQPALVPAPLAHPALAHQPLARPAFVHPAFVHPTALSPTLHAPLPPRAPLPPHPNTTVLSNRPEVRQAAHPAPAVLHRPVPMSAVRPYAAVPPPAPVFRHNPVHEQPPLVVHPATFSHPAPVPHPVHTAPALPPFVHTHPMILATPRPQPALTRPHVSIPGRPQPRQVQPRPQPRPEMARPAVVRPQPSITRPVPRMLPIHLERPAPPERPAPRALPPAARVAPPPPPAPVMHAAPRPAVMHAAPRPAVMHAAPRPSAPPPHPAAPHPAAGPPHNKPA